MSDDRHIGVPSDDTPAIDWLVIEIQSPTTGTGFSEAVVGAARLFFSLVTFGAVADVPKTTVRVSLRESGQVLFVHSFDRFVNRNGDAAALDAATIRSAAERMTFVQFCEEYGVTADAI
jgi:hypothetical protein